MVFEDARNFDFFQKIQKSTALVAIQGNKYWRYYEIEHTPYTIHEWMQSVINKKNKNFKFSKIEIPEPEHLQGTENEVH